MISAKPTFGSAVHTEALVVWTNRALELLWLLTAALIPIAFLDREAVVSEAVISYFEVPKIALLRTLAGLMAILWLIEWGIQGRLPLWDHTTGVFSWPRPSTWPRRLLNWQRETPTRGLVLAVWFFLGSTLLSSVLSASLSVSLWGEIPGQDGYSAYTVAAYVTLFAVIATHLKTKQQLWRLLGAVVFVGVIVSGIGILQHYGHDPLNLAEITGGGAARATSTTGNAIFTAAILMMTIPLSLAAAVMTVPDFVRTSGRFRENAGLWLLGFAIMGFWVVVLTIQLLGITFTLSRGPWMGTLLALTGGLGLTALFVGWGSLGRSTVLLGIATAVTLAVVQWNMSPSSPGLYLVATVALVVLLGLAVVVGWRTLGRLAMISGLAVTLYAAVAWLPSWVDDGAAGIQSNPPVTASDFGQTEVAVRAASIRTYVSTGFFSGRGDTWKRSWELISERPWFTFDSLRVPWLRPLVGYGPDLFRNTYLLKSVPQSGSAPVEPDHAHNFFIHQTVEQGLFGLVSSVGLFMAAFLVGAYQLLWKRHSFTLVHKLILVGVLATLAGRFLEMMVGVARVSDLTVLWVLLAIFVTLPVVFRSEEAEEVSRPRPEPRGGRRRNRRPLGVSLGSSSLTWPLFWRLAIVAWMVGGIGILTWVKSINYVRAAVEIGDAVQEFNRGDPQASLASIDRAIDLAPDVVTYYNYRSQIYFLYQLDDQITPERKCSIQREHPYKVCLAVAAFQSNLEGSQQRPFNYRSRWALANSAFNLKQDDEAIRLYREVASMVPNSVVLQRDVAAIFNEMAEAHLNEGEPREAIRVLEETADFEMDDGNFAKALYLRGVAYDDTGQLEKSAQFLERSLGLVSEGETAKAAHGKLTEVYTKLGWLQLAEEHRAQGQN